MASLFPLLADTVDADFCRLDQLEDDTEGLELDFTPPPTPGLDASDDLTLPLHCLSPLSDLTSLPSLLPDVSPLPSDLDTSSTACEPNSGAAQPAKHRRKRGGKNKNKKKKKAAAEAQALLQVLTAPPEVRGDVPGPVPTTLTCNASSASSASPASPAKTRPNHDSRAKTERRKKIRALARELKRPGDRKIRSGFSKRSLGIRSTKTKVSVRSLPYAKGAFIGLYTKTTRHLPTVQKLRQEGVDILEWEGMCVSLSVLSLILMRFPYPQRG